MTSLSSIVRRLLVTVGVLSLCIALVVSVSPAIEGMLRSPWETQAVLVAFFSVALVLACVLSPFVLVDGGDRSNRTAERPELVRSTPAPGHDLERTLESRLPALPPLARRRRIRAQFRRATIRMLVRTTACSTETAREKIEEGTWTDDSVATRFLRPRCDGDPSRLEALLERVRFPRRARRTARIILARASEEEGRR